MDQRINLGRCFGRGQDLFVTLNELRGRHWHVMGQSGSGKTYFLIHLVQELIRLEASVFVLDFKGDLHDGLVQFVTTQGRQRQAVIVDPADAVSGFGVAPGINPLDEDGTPDTVASRCRWAFKLLFGQEREYNPWLDDIASLTLNLLTHARNGKPWSIFEAIHAVSLHDGRFREQLLSLCEKGLIADRFAQLATLDERKLAEMLNPFLVRLQQLRYSDTLSAIMGQQETTIDFDAIMAKRGVFLMRAYQEGVPQTDLDFLAGVAVQKIRSATFRRPERDRNKPCFLVVDEVQRLCSGGCGEELADFMERARSYGVQVISSHQFLTQLRPKTEFSNTRVLDAMTSQANVRVYFKTAWQDAEVLWGDVFGDRLEHDSNQIKHEQEQTKFRPSLKYLPSYQQSTSHSRATGKTNGYTHGVADGVSHGETRTEGYAETHGESHTRGTSITDGTSSSTTRGESSSESEGHSVGIGHTLSHNAISGMGTPISSRGLSHNRSHQSNRSATQGESEAVTEGSSRARTESESHTVSHSETHSESLARSHEVSHRETEAWNAAVSETNTTGATTGTSWSPSVVHEEFSEVTGVQFYAPQEVVNRYLARLAHQEKRHYVLKFGTSPAARIYTPELRQLPVLSCEVARVKTKVYARCTAVVADVLADLDARVPKFLESIKALPAPEPQRTVVVVPVSDIRAPLVSFDRPGSEVVE